MAEENAENRLYVSNLNWKITDEALLELFAKHGKVEEARIVRDSRTGRSRGYAFVTFVDKAGAAKAQKAINGTTVEERELSVEIARSTGPTVKAEGDDAEKPKKKKKAKKGKAAGKGEGRAAAPAADGDSLKKLEEQNAKLLATNAELKAKLAALTK